MVEDAKFALIRYVPDVVKGERLNIGVLWKHGKETGARLREDWDKLRAIDPNLNIEQIRSAAEFMLALVRRRGELDDSIAREFTSSVQLSPVTPLKIGEQTLEIVIDMIFETLVEARPPAPELTGESRKWLRRIMKTLGEAERERVERGEVEEAKKAFDVIPSDPNRLEEYLSVLAASKNEKDWERAYELARERNIQSAEVYGMLSYRWWSIGRFEQAIDDGESAIRIAENVGPVETLKKLKNSVAYYYADLGRPDHKARALELAREAARERPDEPSVQDTLGYVMIVYSESKEEILRGLKLCEQAWNANGPIRFFAKHVGAAYQRLRSLGYD